MSYMHDIDNEEQAVFQFDPFEEPEPSFCQPSDLSSAIEQSHRLDLSKARSSHDDPLTSGETADEQSNTTAGGSGKGKEVTMPIAIPPSARIGDDLFDPSPSSTAYHASSSSGSRVTLPLSYQSQSSSSFSFSSFIQYDLSQPSVPLSDSPSTSEPVFPNTKGKGKESPPTLPPLALSVSELGYGQAGWPPHGYTPMSPCTSSYSSNYSPPIRSPPLEPINSPVIVDFASQSSPQTVANNIDDQGLRRMPSRRRSLSSLSIRSTRSLASTKAKLKIGLTRTSSFASKLFKKQAQPTTSQQTESIVAEISSPEALRSLNNPSETTVTPSDYLQSGQVIELLQQHVLDGAQVFSIPQTNPVTLLKRNGRSKSLPIPFSALDFVPVSTTDVFQPLTILILNYFDLILPKELRLHILRSLVELHEEDYRQALSDRQWSFNKASSWRGQYVGKEKGFRELIKLRRVSTAWQALVFDGQLWTDLDLHSFRGLPRSVISHLTTNAGPFIKKLDVSGHAGLQPDNLTYFADNLISRSDISYTQLTHINLQGCAVLTTRSLHYLLVRSKFLESLCVKGLGAVTNTTCDILATSAPYLVSLNMSRCSNMDADGIRSLALAALSRGEHLALKELRLSGLKHANDSMMDALGKAAPCLEILDLSYVRQLHNSAIEAFVACDDANDDISLGVKVVKLPAREIGRASDDTRICRRRVTRLRHLSLSYCMLLTDMSCSNLAHSVPNLEFLEMAGIGSDIKDEGLIRLLKTTPYIRRLDLEDASDISDSVLSAITPFNETTPSNEPPQPGHALEHLIISYAGNITEAAFLALIRGCTKMKVLEADNTRLGGTALREFIRLARQRKVMDSKIVAIDCRAIGEGLVRENSTFTRPRLGWRAYSARKLYYLDGRDNNDHELKVGQDECDEMRVVLKTFYSWQTVDAVRAAREKHKKSNSRRTNGSYGSEVDSLGWNTTRWWSPGGRRSGSNSPRLGADMNSTDGCRTM